MVIVHGIRFYGLLQDASRFRRRIREVLHSIPWQCVSGLHSRIRVVCRGGNWQHGSNVDWDGVHVDCDERDRGEEQDHLWPASRTGNWLCFDSSDCKTPPWPNQFGVNTRAPG